MHSDRRHLERLSYSLHDAVLGSSPPKASGACNAVYARRSQGGSAGCCQCTNFLCSLPSSCTSQPCHLQACAAREEVQHAQCRLLRGRPQWQHTSYINKHKFQRPVSDWLLENAVTPDQLSRRDFRSGTTSYRFQLHRDAAFTRVSGQLGGARGVTLKRARQCAACRHCVGAGSCTELIVIVPALAIHLACLLGDWAALSAAAAALQPQAQSQPSKQHRCGRVAFQGDCTTNWDFSTVLDQQARDQQLAEQRQQDCKHSRQRAASLQRYASPMQRAQTSIEQQRAAKRAPAARAEELRKRWGVEGAAAMQQILQMRQPERRPQLRVRQVST